MSFLDVGFYRNFKGLFDFKKGVYFDVVNLGLMGTGVDKYYQFYKLKGRRYKPDTVFVNLYIGNDLYDTFRNNRTPFDRIKNFFASNFYSYWAMQDFYIKITQQFLGGNSNDKSVRETSKNMSRKRRTKTKKIYC